MLAILLAVFTPLLLRAVKAARRIGRKVFEDLITKTENRPLSYDASVLKSVYNLMDYDRRGICRLEEHILVVIIRNYMSLMEHL